MRFFILGVTATIAVSACTREAPSGNAAPAALVDTRATAGSDAVVATAGARDTASPASPNAIVAASAEPARVVREITLPAGTALPVVLEETVGSDISRVEQPVRAHIARPVAVRGQTVVPQGSLVSGVVTDATRSGKVKGRAHVAVRFDTLVRRGDEARYPIQTAAIGRVAPGTKKKDALKIGLPAAGGAVIGGLLGGEKGAVIGGAAGGGAGTAVVMSTRGKEVRLAKGSVLTLRLTRPLTVRVTG
jgi:hypothetical protein